MLYDSRRDKHPRLFAFIAWLRTKPADETYNWNSASSCACHQFFGPFSYDGWAEGHINFNCMAHGPWLSGIPIEKNWTYGKLLARAEAELEKISA